MQVKRTGHNYALISFSGREKKFLNNIYFLIEEREHNQKRNSIYFPQIDIQKNLLKRTFSHKIGEIKYPVKKLNILYNLINDLIYSKYFSNYYSKISKRDIISFTDKLRSLIKKINYIYTTKLLHKSTDKVLKDILGEFHVYHGKINKDPNFIWLNFVANDLIRIKLSSDGWQLLLDLFKPKSIDMQECGKTIIRSMKDDKNIKDLIGKSLKKAFIIKSFDPDGIIGIKLVFDNYECLILNFGDEFYIGKEYPSLFSKLYNESFLEINIDK